MKQLLGDHHTHLSGCTILGCRARAERTQSSVKLTICVCRTQSHYKKTQGECKPVFEPHWQRQPNRNKYPQLSNDSQCLASTLGGASKCMPGTEEMAQHFRSLAGLTYRELPHCGSQPHSIPGDWILPTDLNRHLCGEHTSRRNPHKIIIIIVIKLTLDFLWPVTMWSCRIIKFSWKCLFWLAGWIQYKITGLSNAATVQMCLPPIHTHPGSPCFAGHLRYPTHTFLSCWQAHRPLHLRAGSYTPLFRHSVLCSIAVEHCATSGQGQQTPFYFQPKKQTLGAVSWVFYQLSIVLKKPGSLQSSLSRLHSLPLPFLTQHLFHVGPCW